MNDRIREDPLDEAPPVLPSWTHWYVLVLSVLVILIILFTFFTKMYD
jgi:hypothetical protein